jgi:hypothetical protein
LTLLIYELFFYPPNFSFPFFFFYRFSLEVSIIIPIFAPGALPANGEAASAGGAIGGLIYEKDVSPRRTDTYVFFVYLREPKTMD